MYNSTTIAIIDDLMKTRKPFTLYTSFCKDNRIPNHLNYLFSHFEQKYTPAELQIYITETLEQAYANNSIKIMNHIFSENTVTNYLFGIKYSYFVKATSRQPIVNHTLISATLHLREHVLNLPNSSLHDNALKRKCRKMMIDAVANSVPLASAVRLYHSRFRAGLFQEIQLTFESPKSKLTIENYVEATINKGIRDGLLIMPQDNNVRAILKFLLSECLSRDHFYQSQSNLCITLRQAIKKVMSLNTLSHLKNTGNLKIEDCKTNNALCTDEIYELFRKRITSSVPVADLSSLFQRKGQKNVYAYIVRNILPQYTDNEWLIYICSTMKIIYSRSLSTNIVSIEHCIKTIFGERVYSQYYSLGPHHRFTDIIEKSLTVIRTRYLFVSKTIEKEFITAIMHNEYLAQPVESYKARYSDTHIHYLQDVIIPHIGNDAFKAYLETVINKGFFESDCKSDVQNFSKKILGFPIHSITSKDKYSTFQKLFYSVWLNLKLDNFKNRNTRENVYNFLEMSNEAQRKFEIKKIGFDLQLLNDYSKEDVITLIDCIIHAKFITRRKTFTKSDFYCKLFNCSRKKLFANFVRIEEINHYEEVEAHLEEMIRKSNDLLIGGNLHEIQTSVKPLKLFYKFGHSLRCATLDFSNIESLPLKTQLRLYLSTNYTPESTQRTAHVMQRVIHLIHYLEQTFAVQTLSDIKTTHIESLLHHMQYKKKVTPCTVSGYLSGLSSIFDFFVRTPKHKYGCNSNPCKLIQLYNTTNYVQETSNIPVEVLKQLDTHIHELKPKYALMYELYRRTGCRFIEIALLKVDDLIPEDDKWAQIRIIPYKTLKARRKNGLSDYTYKHIPILLYNRLISYIFATAPERERLGANDIFLGECKGRPSTISSGTFNWSINKLIETHNIRTSTGELWRLTSKQLRKTFAVGLINNDTPLQVVQNALGHTTPETTALYYAKVEMMRISQLNHKFFEKMFNAQFSEENLKQFSEGERKLLYTDFCLNKRSVEFGYCTIHPSEGSCKSIYQSSCSTCPKLCTGLKFLPIWEDRIQEKTQYLHELEKLYQRNGIPRHQYLTFPEYLRINQSLEWDTSIVKKILASEN